MQIGEFATAVGASARMLRHYEDVGLLTPGRDANGYRSYDASQIPRARQVTELVRTGVPTRAVRDLLSVLTDLDGTYPEHVDPGVVDDLEHEWDRMCRCIACMQNRRDALRAYLDRLDQGVTSPPPTQSVPRTD